MHDAANRRKAPGPAYAAVPRPASIGVRALFIRAAAACANGLECQ